MDIDPASLDPEQTYKLLTGIVVPRPIAWVATLSAEGRVNLAPFSCFTYVSVKPPMIGINVGRRAGKRKDTAANIHARGEFVVHIADRALVAPVHQSAVEHPPEVSEAELLGLATAPSLRIATPRIAAAPIALECRLHRAIAFGDTGSEFIVGEVVAMRMREGLCRNGKIDTRQLDPICRLAGPNYAVLGEIVTMAPIAQTAKSVLP